MATSTIAKDIVKLEEGVKKLKTTQYAYGKQYIGLETVAILNGTIRYNTGWQGNRYYDLYGYFEFNGQSDFPVVGIKKCRVFINNTEIGIKGAELDEYSQFCNKLNGDIAKLIIGRYTEGDEALNAQNYELTFSVDVPSGSSLPIPEGSSARIEITFNSNTAGTAKTTVYET